MNYLGNGTTVATTNNQSDLKPRSYSLPIGNGSTAMRMGIPNNA